MENNKQGVRLTRLGQLGCLLESGGIRVAIDVFLSPCEGRLVGPLLDESALATYDYIIGTHDHSDHIDRPLWARVARMSERPIFLAPQSHIASLHAECGIPKKRLIGLEEGWVIQQPGLVVESIAAAHELLTTDAQGFHPALSLVLSLGGIRFFHSGDMCLYEGLHAKIRAHGPLDAMLLPINGRDGKRLSAGCIGNITYQEAVDLAGALAPKLVIPGHYDMFEQNSADPQAFLDYCRVKYPMQRCEALAAGESLWILPQKEEMAP